MRIFKQLGQFAAVDAGDVREDLFPEGAPLHFPEIVDDFGNRATQRNVSPNIQMMKTYAPNQSLPNVNQIANRCIYYY